MEKFRIVEVISNSGNSERKGTWIIEEKKFFRWREIVNNEGPKTKSVQHNSYKDAELYLLEKYTGHGELINWHHKRCGKSEEAHSVMKEGLAGGKLPSSAFGENAAWWWIMVLAFNLNSAMKQLVLQGPWVTQRMKAISFRLLGCRDG